VLVIERILGVSVAASCNSMEISYSLRNSSIFPLKVKNIVDRHICGLTFVEYKLLRWGYWPDTGQHFVVLYRFPAWLPVL